MKEYINQFYNEGLATTFYLKPVKYLQKKIKNQKVLKVLLTILKIFYTIVILLFALYMFNSKYPL